MVPLPTVLVGSVGHSRTTWVSNNSEEMDTKLWHCMKIRGSMENGIFFNTISWNNGGGVPFGLGSKAKESLSQR